jgi:hypothetical protein
MSSKVAEANAGIHSLAMAVAVSANILGTGSSIFLSEKPLIRHLDQISF